MQIFYRVDVPVLALFKDRHGNAVVHVPAEARQYEFLA